jgi:prevent-host-death family protein
MGIAVRDIVAFSDARTNLSKLVDEVQKGAEKIITKNGEPAVALIDWLMWWRGALWMRWNTWLPSKHAVPAKNPRPRQPLD